MCIVKKEGFLFAFDGAACKECGGFCCCGESGYIFLDSNEIAQISERLGFSVEEFHDRFVYQVGERYSLIEKPDEQSDGYACVFFDEKRRCCGIYEVRPKQCREFPFWRGNRGRNLEEMKRQCPFLKPL